MPVEALRRLSFWLRGVTSWSLPAWKRTVTLEALRETLDAQALSRLEARFDLSGWAARCDEQDWRESLYVLDVLSRVLPQALPPGRALDVGSKNGTYFSGLVTAQPREWDLVELDAHRRYAWGATRRAHGERMVRGLPGSRFIAGDVRALTGSYAVVTWFLPFLHQAPLDAWGLPRNQLAPEALLRHVHARLVPGGVLLIVNQGDKEAALQRALFERVGLEARSLGQVRSALSPFTRERFGWLVRAGT